MRYELRQQRKYRQRVSAWLRFAPPLFGLLLALATSTWAAETNVVLGLSSGGQAEAYNVEFQRYSRMLPLYKENNIQASFMDASGLINADWTEDKLYQTFKKYHVCLLYTSPSPRD